MEQFVDREDELDQLTDSYEAETAAFGVIHGRSRLGKSELVRQSIADRDGAVYYQAVESTAQSQSEQFGNQHSGAHIRECWLTLGI